MLQTDKTVRLGKLKSYLSKFGGTAVLIICLSVLCAFSIVKDVQIDNGYGQVISVVTMESTVGDLLDEQQITLNKGDVVFPALDSGLQQKQEIKIQRAVKVKITADGKTKKISTVAKNVGEALSHAGITLKELDECSLPVQDKVFNNMEIKVTRVRSKTVTEDSVLSRNVVRKNDASLTHGTEKVISEGHDGVVTKTYTVTERDGVEIGRKLVSETVKQPAQDKVILVGTKFEPGSKVPLSSLNIKGSVNMHATAYDIGFESCGKHPGDPGYGITATGIPAHYGIVAVDPNVIPLGSKLYIQSQDGSYVYGYALAADTGGAIKGNRIDLCYDSRAEALQFGRRNVVVYILA